MKTHRSYFWHLHGRGNGDDGEREDLPPQVKAIIEDCGYTSVDAQLSYQLSRMYHLPSFPLLNTTSLVTKLKAGYSFSEASALEQIKKNKLPILFIHGAEDWFVPVSMVYELYEACPSEKELYIVEGAGHGAPTARTLKSTREELPTS